MLSSRINYSARPTKVGFNIQNKDSGQKLQVGVLEDGLTLRGDGFDHSIRVDGDQIQVSKVDGQQEASFEKLPYLEGSRRIASSVASVLTGLPVNAFTGEKPERVYVNMSFRPGMGIRNDGSLKGGRYRVTGIDRELRDVYEVRGTEAWHGQVMRMSGTSGPHSPTTDFATRSGRPISITSAFRRMTGTTFAEQIQGGVGEIWREAGKPQTPGRAAEVADHLFNSLYRYEDNYNIYIPEKESKEVLDYLNYLSADKSWSFLEEALDKKYDAKKMLKKLHS